MASKSGYSRLQEPKPGAKVSEAYPRRENLSLSSSFWPLLVTHVALLLFVCGGVAYTSWLTRAGTLEGQKMVIPLYGVLSTTSLANKAYAPAVQAAVTYINPMQMAAIVFGLYGVHFLLNIINMLIAVWRPAGGLGSLITSVFELHGYSQNLARGLNTLRWLVGFNFSGLFLAIVLVTIGSPYLAVVQNVIVFNAIASLFYISAEHLFVEETHLTPKYQQAEAIAREQQTNSTGAQGGGYDAYSPAYPSAHHNDAWNLLTIGMGITSQMMPYIIYYWPYEYATGILKAEATLEGSVNYLFYMMLAWSVFQMIVFLFFLSSPRKAVVLKEFVWGALNIACATSVCVQLFRVVVADVSDLNATLASLAWW